jgi:hypothetical protein
VKISINLNQLLNTYRQESQNQREKGTYFEELNGSEDKSALSMFVIVTLAVIR